MSNLYPFRLWKKMLECTALLMLFCFGAVHGQTVTISPATVQTICPGQAVPFVANLNGRNPATIQSVDWIFEGGNPATFSGFNPTVGYAVSRATPYNVTLNVRFTDGTSQPSITLPLVQVFEVTTPITVTNVTCNGQFNGTASLSIVGSGNYNIIWMITGGSAPNNQRNVTGLPAGNHMVVVTDLAVTSACGTVNIPFSITEPPAIVITPAVLNVTCFGLNDGDIDLGTPAGGPSGVYTYAWSDGGPAVPRRTALAPSNYSVTVTSGACTAVRNFTVTEPLGLSAFVLNQNRDSVSCNGLSDGDASVSVVGGTPIDGGPNRYLYQWSHDNTKTDSILADVPAGNYVVTITDANNCEFVLIVNVAQPDQIRDVILNIDNVSCNGANDGSISIDIRGGTQTYTYLWAGPGIITQPLTPEDLSALRPGTYNLTLNDRNGCQAFFSYNITEPAPLAVNLDNLRDVNCFGRSDGQALITVTGGTTPYRYEWTRNGINGIFSVNEDLVNVPAGTYLLTLRDANDCNFRFNVEIRQPSVFAFDTLQVTNPSCPGARDGSIRVQFSGGTQPYTIVWNTGTVIQDNLVNLTADLGPLQNPYSVTVTDARGCQIDTSVTLVAGAPVQIDLVSITEPGCFGANTGAINTTISGGRQPYLIAWSGTVSQNEDLTGIPCGTYTMEVTDNAGQNQSCTARRTFTLNCRTQLTLTAVFTNALCNAANSGNITLTPAGGTPFTSGTPYRYTWTRDGNPFGNPQNLVNLVAGTYCVTVNDAQGCTVDSCFIITQPTVLTASITASQNVTCFGAGNGSATVTPVGGTPPYTYAWNNGAATPSISNLNPGTYSVVVTDRNGCRTANPISVAITQPTRLSVTLGNRVNVSCLGGNDGQIAVNATGGTPRLNGTVPFYNYTWSDGLGRDLDTRTGLTSGTYTVTVTDSLSCTASLTVTLTQPANGISLSITGKRDVNCTGGTNGSIDLRATGGTPPYTFNWSNGASTEDILNLNARQYCVTVTDQRNCSSVICQVITEPTPLVVTVSSSVNETCAGNNDGRIVLQIIGGTAPYFSIWSNGVRNRDLFNVPAGVYTVTVVDGRGCQQVLTEELTAPERITVVVDSLRNVSCNGRSDGAIYTRATGGSGNYTFTWSPGNSPNPNLTGLTAGTYTLTVTDGTGCRTVFSQVITAPQTLQIVTSQITNPGCNGEAAGSINLTVTGGTPDYTYSWSQDPARNRTNAENLPAGSYTFTVRDSNGCTLSQTFILTDAPALTGSVAVTPERCAGDFSGILTANITGGTPPYRYDWSTLDTGQIVLRVRPGTYALTVRDARGCTLTINNAIMPVVPQLTFGETFITTPTCRNLANGAIQVNMIGGTPPLTYLWSNGETDEDVENVPAGTYCITVTDANGCVRDSCFNLLPPEPITVTTDVIIRPSCSGISNGVIEITVTGGTAPYQYFWSNSAATEDISNLAPGTYCLTIVDAVACSETTCFTLTREPNPTVRFNLPGLNYCADDTLIVFRATPSGGVFTGRGIVNDSLFNPRLAGAGTIILTYSGNLFGCPYTGTTAVRVNALPDSVGFFIGRSDTASQFCADNTAPFNLNFAPLTPGIQYTFSGPGVRQISPGRFEFLPSVAGIGTHILRGSMTNRTTGCIRDYTKTVTVIPPIDVTLSVDQNIICRGTTTILRATGGFTYEWSPSSGLSCAPNCKNFSGTVVAAPTATTVYTVIGKSGACIERQTVRVEVIQTPTITVTANRNNVCSGQSVVLRAASTGLYSYLWQPRGLFQGGTGPSITINPQVTDTFTVLGQLPDGCFRTASIVIRVLPARVIAEADQALICLGSGTVLRARSTEPGNFTYTWSPAAGLSSVRGADVVASPRVTTNYTVTRSGSGNCRTAVVRLEVQDTNARFTNTFASSYCNQGTAPQTVVLTATPPGGTFSGPGVTGNVFSASIGPGTYTITYSGDINGCPFSTRTQVRVQNPRSPKILNFTSEYCSIKSPVQLVTDLPGTIITGNGMLAGNVFSPIQAGLGTHVLNVTLPPGTTGCFTDTSYLVAVSEPTVAINGLSAFYCGQTAPITLTGVPAGGRFIGRGIRNGNIFDPALAGIGVHTITYYGRDVLCTYSLTRSVRVQPALTASALVTPVTDPFTPNGSAVITVGGGSGNYVYLFNNQNPPVPTNTFNNLQAGTYPVIVFDLVSSCSVTLTVTIPSNAVICNPPAVPTVGTRTDNSANVSWIAVPGALSYELDYYRSSNPSGVITVPLTTTTYNLPNLICGTEYRVTVRAICGTDIISPNSPELTFSTTSVGCPNNCTAPADIVASDITETAFRLTWIGVPAALTYELRYKKINDPDPGTVLIIPAGDTSRLLQSLEPGTRYAYLIRSLCQGGVTSEFIGDTVATLSPCKVPQNIRVEPITARTATITWNAQPNAVRYVVSWRETGQTTFNIDTVTQNRLPLTGLTPGFEYEFDVQALCGSLGNSLTTELDTFNTNALAECRTPTELRSLPVNNTSQMVIWSPVDGAIEYVVEYRIKAGTTIEPEVRVTRNAAVLTGLRSGTEYVWNVRAICAEGSESSVSKDTTFTTAGTNVVCAAPTNLRVTNITNFSALLNWNAVPGAVRYEITYRAVNAGTDIIVTSINTSIGLTGLSAGTRYRFTVRSVCAGNLFSEPATGPEFTTTGNASCPNLTDIQVSQITGRTAQVRWTGIIQATLYEIEYAPAPGDAFQVRTASGSPFVIEELNPGTEYIVRVRAICGQLTSGFLETTFRTSNVSNSCPAPVNLTVTNVGTDNISLIWNGSPSAVGYQVEYRGAGEPFARTINTNSTSVTLTGLTSGLSYTIVVRTVCAGNLLSSDTPPVSAVTNSGNGCPAPVNVRVISTTSGSAELVWDGVLGAVRYLVSYKPRTSPGRPQTVSFLTPGGTLPNLLGNEEYVFFVETVCASGDTSLPTADLFFKTVPGGECPAPQNATFYNVTDRSVTVTWSQVPAAIAYEVNYRINGILQFTTVRADRNLFVLDGLLPGTRYEVLLRTICRSGISNDDNFVIRRFTTLSTVDCSAPENLAVTNLTASGATLNWNPVPGALSYVVGYRLKGTLLLSEIPASVNSSSLSGLISGQTYEWVVRSVCGTSSTSPDVIGPDFTIPFNTCGNTSFTSIVPASNHADLTWTAVSGVVRYEIRYQLLPSGPVLTQTAGINLTSIRIPGLTANSNYGFQIRALCSGGPGEFSSVVTVTTTAQSLSCQTPAGLRVAPGVNTATVFWNAAVPNAIGYSINYRVVGQVQSTTVNVSGGNLTSFTLRNLSPDTQYEVRILTRCGTVNSVYSTYVRFWTLPRRMGAETDATEPEFTFGVYPNPFRNTLSVSHNFEENLKLEVFDLTGRKLFYKTVSQPTEELNLETLPAGVYLLRVSGATLTRTLKVVKE